MPEDAYKYFRVEARELLGAIQHGVLELEKDDGSNRDVVANLLRALHTLKGAARIVRQAVIAREAHDMETVLAPYRGSSRPVSKEDVEALLRHVDTIANALGAIGETLEARTPPRAVRDSGTVEAATQQRADSLRVGIAEIDALNGAIFDLDESFARLGRVAADIESAEELARRARSTLVDGPEAATLSALRSAVTQAKRDLAESISAIGARARTVREHVNRLRLVPAGNIEGQLERAARDAAQELRKRVQLRVTGGENYIDEHVLTSVRDALLHLVRNAVAHGLESEAERLRAGKPPVGRIEIVITREGSRVRFRCTDDGRGIDVDAVRRSAARIGISHDAHRPAHMEEAMSLIFQTGISTTSELTALSGRGIGLDAVRENVQRLKGEMDVSSEAKQGTTFSILVPILLSSLVGIRVRAGNATFCFPMDAVLRAMKLSPEEAARASGTRSLPFDGDEIAFYPLAPAKAMRERNPGDSGANTHVLIVRSRGRTLALGVDQILGIDDLVMKPPPESIADLPLLGISFDAEGRPIPIVDPLGITEVLQQRPAGGDVTAEPLSVLVVDDSLTSRMVEQSILESAGYEVDLASSGEEGLEKTRSRRYGLFVVDVDMPGISGFEFVARLRADPTHRDVPSIIVSSRASAEDRKRGADVGARGYLVKSQYAREDLLGMISKLVG